MEILSHHDRKELIGYLTYVKSSLNEWQVVDIALTPDSDISVTEASEIIHSVFRNTEGKIYVCNKREILMLIRWGMHDRPEEVMIANKIITELPKDSCKVRVKPPTEEGIFKIEISIKHKPPSKPSFSDIRTIRRENIALIADDDAVTRALIKTTLDGNVTVHEITNGNEVMEYYKKYMPDILFLDIHLPGVEGMDILRDLHFMDRSAYILMLSADSSRENVELSAKNGAKGFLAKPFTKEKLIELVHKCPTLY